MKIELNLPPGIHHCLEINPHRVYYESVGKHTEGWSEDEISDVDRRYAKAADELWVLTWYPQTPVGFCRVAAPTAERLNERLKEFNR